MVNSQVDGPELVVRQAFEAATLMREFPPRFELPLKKLVYSLSMAGSQPTGTLVYSRWRSAGLPDQIPAEAPQFEIRERVFEYEPSAEGVFQWTLNFADPYLFFAYTGRLLAQDELQVLEHPALGSLYEALSASSDPRLRPVTVEDGANTPVLVRGVERRCALSTDPNPLEGRPQGLYGNQFARAKEDAVRKALRVIDPPTTSNILAMAAPVGGTGRYTTGQIREILETAYTGFASAKLEAERALGPCRVVVNTGHWGTGAFGGNRVLMTLLQQVAARLAGIDRLVYHTVTSTGAEPCREAQHLIDRLVPPGAVSAVSEVVAAVEALGLRWGVSDGN